MIFQLESGMDVSITLEIDTDLMTKETATEINHFWSGAYDVLDASEGCVYQAVARRASGCLLSYLMEGLSMAGAVRALGWSGIAHGGISILSYDLPDLDPVSLDVRVLEPAHV